MIKEKGKEICQRVLDTNFEAGNLDKAFELWQNLVKQKGVGYRYFENDDPKYIEFYKSRK